MYKRGGYSKDFQHRLGFIRNIPSKKQGNKRIWIQAVSVGEILAIEPLIDELKACQGIEVIITTTTSTAYKIANDKYKDSVLKIAFFPLDFFLFSKNAWRKICPDFIILMESELWPEHMHQAKKRNVPIALINARMSDRSFRRYNRFGLAAAWLLEPIQIILAATEQDKERLLALGANPQNTACTGSLKFDVEIKPILNEEAKAHLKKNLGFHAKNNGDSAPIILLGSSTWSGEEATLLLALEDALEAGFDCRLLLVPRHAERRDEITALLETQSQKWHLRSRSTHAPDEVVIHVADTTGELSRLTQVADIAFIGKSLAPNNGGQTPIEAAAIGIPMVYGPNMNNFRQICGSLEERSASIRTKNSQETREAILRLINDRALRAKMTESAKAWHRSNMGAGKRTFETIMKYLDGSDHQSVK